MTDGTRSRHTLAAPALGCVALTSLAFTCFPVNLPETGAVLFTSPQMNPVAMSTDGTQLYIANTTAGTLSIVDVSNPAAPQELAQIPVGLDPVSVAVRAAQPPDAPELVYVANHVSDSISVVDPAKQGVVATFQELDADGVTTTNEPVGLAFGNPNRLFVSLDQTNQVWVLDLDASGLQVVASQQLQITAQGPRALTVSNGHLYVAAFESGNQTEFPLCPPSDLRGLDEGNPNDEGCEFTQVFLAGITFFNGFDIELGFIVDFAAETPNQGGRIIRDRGLPDRDLFVFDVDTLNLVDVVQGNDDGTELGVGTLLYGVAADNDRLYVTNTEARNQLDGLAALDNRMFENRLTILDCPGGNCGAPTFVDLDDPANNNPGVTVPTPYGIAFAAGTLVASVAGSDGLPASTFDTPPGQTDIPGLVTLDPNTGVVLGAVQTGAIPQGLAISADGQTAYVLNTVDSTLSVVDVSNVAAPAITANITIGSDPTPPNVRSGRIQFNTARASTSGTFSCESCHPNGNIDQLLWGINTVNGPNDGPDPNGSINEPRTTMPIRGLRDTLPLHWDGSLGDPFGGPNGEDPGGDFPPNCVAGEQSCFRHLVNGSLSAVMCEQIAGCPDGVVPDGVGGFLPGALSEARRNDLADFLGSVSYPTSPERRPSDVLSPEALQGVVEFFTDDDGLGIAGGIGGALTGFAPITCADNSGGCHALPLTVSTNSPTVGSFEAPTIRGQWDRFLIFSNGNGTTDEILTMAQDCADGIIPFPPGLLPGDPCHIDLSFAGLSELRAGWPSTGPGDPVGSGEHIYDFNEGLTERGSWAGSHETLFNLAYGVPATNTWEYVLQLSVGLPGLTGRQLHIDASNSSDADVVAALDQISAAAGEGRITGVARGIDLGELILNPNTSLWTSPTSEAISWTAQQLRNFAAGSPTAVTVTAHLPENISIGGLDRQPLLDIHPDTRAEEIENGMGEAAVQVVPAIPRPIAGVPTTLTLGASYVDPDATVLIDGVLCPTCTIAFGVAPVTGKTTIDVDLPALAEGMHILQAQNPHGWVSSEMPVRVDPAP